MMIRRERKRELKIPGTKFTHNLFVPTLFDCSQSNNILPTCYLLAVPDYLLNSIFSISLCFLLTCPLHSPHPPQAHPLPHRLACKLNSSNIRCSTSGHSGITSPTRIANGRRTSTWCQSSPQSKTSGACSRTSSSRAR